MSRSTPPNSSSELAPGGAEAAAQGGDSGAGLRALAGRLAEELGVGPETVARVAALFGEVQLRAPDLYVPAPGALALAFAQAAQAARADCEPVYRALGEWALDAQEEPLERMRRDCLRLQNALTRGALRLYGAEPERCTEELLALERFGFLQAALLAALAARAPEAGAVVRTLPTPEYAAFLELVRGAIDSHRDSRRQLALLVIHVPKVEQVDRLLGLQRGEAFMLRVTRRMREGVLRPQDQLGRVSRDQLACLLPGIAGPGVAILAANKILGALEAPVPIGERSFAPDAAIGIAVFPEHGEEAQALVRNGKLAATAARGAPERFALYEPEHGAAEERRVHYEARLRRALEENALELRLAPRHDAASGAVAALGCVLRWDDTELGEVAEAQALEVAEGAGLARELAWWTFNNALRSGAELARAGLPLALAVKAAAGALQQPDFPEFVDRALRTWGVAPSRLLVEIPESAFAGALERATDTLGRLKALGLRLGIDGFGTGFSRLSDLAQLPLDEVCLGARFVGDMRRQSLHARIVRSLIDLARALELRVTAEGVPDAETAEALAALGCSRIAGPYLGAPLTLAEVVARYGGRT